MKFNNYIQPKSVIQDGLAIRFPNVRFVETYDALNEIGTNFDEDITYLSDVDCLGSVGEKAFGIQVKLMIEGRANGSYFVSEQMKHSFADFTSDFSGKVFIVFSLDGEIANPKIIGEIADEIARLQT